METPKTISLGSEPNYNTGWQVLARGAIGLGVGIVIGFLIFIILLMVQNILQPALENNISATGSSINPLLPLILIVIAFITTFIGNVILAGVYNLFYSTKYYDLGKMFSMSLLSNVIVFFGFAPLYLLYFNNINNLFGILGFQVLFSIFASYTHIEILTNPNYGSSHLIGTTIGTTVSAILFLVALKAMGAGSESRYLILLPPVIGYICIPFFHALWEKIYYKFYENGNDFLYLPTLQEINQQEQNTNQTVTNNDITVNLD